jgi:hypothetical protein
MPEQFDLSRELQEFIVLTLGLGLENLKESGVLIPMIVSVKDNEYTLCVLAGDNISAVEQGANYLSSLPSDPDRYAVMFIGQIAYGNSQSSAVVAHLGERGQPYGHTAIQAYDPETFSALGQPQYFGQADQLLGRRKK